MLISPMRAYFRYVPFQRGKAFLWNRVASHLWWLETTVRAPTIFGTRLTVNAQDVVGRYIYYFGIWEPNLTHWLFRTLNSGDVFVDVGANVGYFSLIGSRLVGGSGRVIALEPLSDIYRLLEVNIEANAALNVRPVKVAAWNESGRIEMFSRTAVPAGTSTSYASWAQRWNLVPMDEPVTALPLASILSEDELRRARVIKIDAEGAEWRIMQGLETALPTCNEELELVIEIAPDLLAEDGASPADLIALFDRHGFVPYRLENDYSGSAYYQRGAPRPPERLDDIPENTEQFDAVFSRKKARVL